eukprot:5033574-Alexandrium_andersonii.AAC.1
MPSALGGSAGAVGEGSASGGAAASGGMPAIGRTFSEAGLHAAVGSSRQAIAGSLSGLQALRTIAHNPPAVGGGVSAVHDSRSG